MLVFFNIHFPRRYKTCLTINFSYFRAYAAWSDGIEVDPTLQSKEGAIFEEYQAKLIFCDNEVMPDPLLTKNGWKREEEDEGLLSWPSINYLDIANLIGVTQNDFLKRMQSEYKQGKCYRYFSCEFVREVLYHPITETSKYCMLKTRVIPSQRLNNKAYEVWAIVNKDLDTIPGGEIQSAHCTCTAGLVGTCNHVVAMLFRVEYAVRHGLTKPTSTSTLCYWNVPSGVKINLQPTKFKELYFDKSQYLKGKKQQAIDNKKKFLQFSPSWDNTRNKLQNKKTTRDAVYKTIKNDIHGSCLWEILEGRSLSVEKFEYENAIDCPTIISLAETFLQNNKMESINLQDLIEKFKCSLQYSTEQINALSLKTQSQSQSNEWYNHRIGRITASKFHRVYTRSFTLQSLEPKDVEKSAIAIIKEIMGYNKKISTYALKHGLSEEQHAISKYKQVTKKYHKKFKSNDSGLVIYKEKPFIAASPDQLVECQCCGAGLVEIKCPYRIRSEIPSAANLDYLHDVIKHDGKITSLKKNCAYYFQVQGQMAVTGRSYCDFFVYTTKGYFKERITYDRALWSRMEAQFEWFWKCIICPEIFLKTVKKSLDVSVTK